MTTPINGSTQNITTTQKKVETSQTNQSNQNKPSTIGIFANWTATKASNTDKTTTFNLKSQDANGITKSFKLTLDNATKLITNLITGQSQVTDKDVTQGSIAAQEKLLNKDFESTSEELTKLDQNGETINNNIEQKNNSITQIMAKPWDGQLKKANDSTVNKVLNPYTAQLNQIDELEANINNDQSTLTQNQTKTKQTLTNSGFVIDKNNVQSQIYQTGTKQAINTNSTTTDGVNFKSNQKKGSIGSYNGWKYKGSIAVNESQGQSVELSTDKKTGDLHISPGYKTPSIMSEKDIDAINIATNEAKTGTDFETNSDRLGNLNRKLSIITQHRFSYDGDLRKAEEQYSNAPTKDNKAKLDTIKQTVAKFDKIQAKLQEEIETYAPNIAYIRDGFGVDSKSYTADYKNYQKFDSNNQVENSTIYKNYDELPKSEQKTKKK